MRRRAPLRRGTIAAARLAAAVLLCVMWLVPAAIARAEGPQPDPCTFLGQYPDATKTELGDLATMCEASFLAPGTQTLVFLEVQQHRDANSVATAKVAVDLVTADLVGAAAPYGQTGFAGTSPTDSYIIVFAWHNYHAWLGTNNTPKAIDAAKDAASTLNAAMQAGIGPPASAATPPPGPGGSPAPSPSGSGGALEVGIGCGQDGMFLRCTSSVSGQSPTADLAYHWTIDGIDQAATAGTMEVDLKATRVRAATHTVKVTVTDQVSGQTGSRDLTIETTIGWFAVTAPTCTSGSGTQGSFELRCTTTVLNAPAGAELTFDWNVDGKVQQGGPSMSRDVQQGIVAVAVSARDLSSGQFTAAETAQYVVNGIGIITDILTGGQTSDPQNVIDEITGSALGAAALGAGAVIAGAFGAIGGVASAGAGAGGAAAGTSGTSSALGGSASGTGAGGASQAPDASNAGAAVPVAPPANAWPTAAQVGDAAGDLLGAEAGALPPVTPAFAQAWKDLSGWPPGEIADEAFMNTMQRAVGNQLQGQALLDHLRAEAQAVWQELKP